MQRRTKRIEFRTGQARFRREPWSRRGVLQRLLSGLVLGLSIASCSNDPPAKEESTASGDSALCCKQGPMCACGTWGCTERDATCTCSPANGSEQRECTEEYTRCCASATACVCSQNAGECAAGEVRVDQCGRVAARCFPGQTVVEGCN